MTSELWVRPERNGWRDEAISRRHREFWGFNCPAVDLDFPMAEYDTGCVVAVVEYKHHKAQAVDLSRPNYRALLDLADNHNPPLPFFVAFYWPDVWAFRIIPVNGLAQMWFDMDESLSEREFVTRLYWIRDRVIATEVLERLNNQRAEVTW